MVNPELVFPTYRSTIDLHYRGYEIHREIFTSCGRICADQAPSDFLLCGICCKLAKCSMFIRSQLQVHYVFKIFFSRGSCPQDII